MAQKPVTRLNINISERQQAQLAALKDAREASFTDLVKDGLNLLSWLEECRSKGKRILTRDADGKITEIEFL